MINSIVSTLKIHALHQVEFLDSLFDFVFVLNFEILCTSICQIEFNACFTFQILYSADERKKE
jgi:hypothetical protein